MVHLKEPYRLSFTAASVMLPSFVHLALTLLENDMDMERLTKAHIGKEKARTNIRQLRELKHRLQALTDQEINILANANLVDQKHMALLSICKTYRLIFDFVVEVLRDKALVYDYEIRESDYNSFVNRKSFDHPELEGLAETSRIKIKTVLFRMLEEVGLINSAKARIIQPVFVTYEVEKVIVEDNPELLKIFLKPDREIAGIDK